MIEVRSEKKGVSAPWVKRVLAHTLKAEKSLMDLNILITGDREIRKINKKFLKHDYATDVISFPLDSDLLGELVISAEFAVGEATKRKIPVEEELLRYVAHGILHLLGYDDHRPADRTAMWKRQERELSRALGRASTPR